MTDYEAKFESLSCFDKNLDNDPEEYIRFFLKGLKSSIIEKVYQLNCNSIGDAIRMTMRVEQNRVDASRFLDKKRGSDGMKSGGYRKK